MSMLIEIVYLVEGFGKVEVTRFGDIEEVSVTPRVEFTGVIPHLNNHQDVRNWIATNNFHYAVTKR